jgi:hypothetical protein
MKYLLPTVALLPFAVFALAVSEKTITLHPPYERNSERIVEWIEFASQNCNQPFGFEVIENSLRYDDEILISWEER